MNFWIWQDLRTSTDIIICSGERLHGKANVNETGRRPSRFYSWYRMQDTILVYLMQFPKYYMFEEWKIETFLSKKKKKKPEQIILRFVSMSTPQLGTDLTIVR